MSLRAATGLVAGFGGVIMVVSSQLGSHGGAGNLVLGCALALVAALGWSAGTLIVKELLQRRPDTDLIGLTSGQYVVGGVVLAVIALAAEGTGSAEWSAGDLWLAVAYVVILSSVIATLAFFAALRLVSATRATAWGFISPAVAVLLEIVLGHTPKPITLVGMAVTIAGVAIVNAAPAQAAAARPLEPAVADSPSLS